MTTEVEDEAVGRALFDPVKEFEVPTSSVERIRSRIRTRRRRRTAAATGLAVVVLAAAGVAGVAALGEDSVTTVGPVSPSEASDSPVLSARADAMSTQLPNGSVLTFGGVDAVSGAALADGQVFDPDEASYMAIPEAPEPRTSGTAVANDDVVVVMGGLDGPNGALASSALSYDVSAGQWQVLDAPESFGERPPAALASGDPVVWSASGSIWGLDPDQGQWVQRAFLDQPASASLLDVDGTLVAAGVSADGRPAVWVIQDGTALALPSPEVEPGATRTGFVEVAPLSGRLVVWGYSRSGAGAQAVASVSVLDLNESEPAWKVTGSVPFAQNDRWSWVTAGPRIWTWQVGETYSIIETDGVEPSTARGPGRPGAAFPLTDQSFAFIDPAATAEDLVQTPASASYSVVELPAGP